MRFLSSTVWNMGAVLLFASFINACTKDEEAVEDVKEPVEDATPAATEPGDTAAPPAAATEAEPAAPQAAAPITEPTAPAAAVPAGSASRRVMYVKSNGTAVREKPDAHAKVIRKLERGEHMLVNIEGDWARTDQGGYIALKGLSEKGIGRAKAPVRWKGGRADSVAPAARKPAAKAPAKAATPQPAPAKPEDAAAKPEGVPPPAADAPAEDGAPADE